MLILRNNAIYILAMLVRMGSMYRLSECYLRWHFWRMYSKSNRLKNAKSEKDSMLPPNEHYRWHLNSTSKYNRLWNFWNAWNCNLGMCGYWKLLCIRWLVRLVGMWTSRRTTVFSHKMEILKYFMYLVVLGMTNGVHNIDLGILFVDQNRV